MPMDADKLAAFAKSKAARAGIDIPALSQETDYSCGAAALLAVLRYFGVDDGAGEEDLYGKLRTTPEQGTAPEDISRVADEYGLRANWRTGVRIEDLQAAVEEGVPVILNIQAWNHEPAEPKASNADGHYVVLVAASDAGVEFMDPSLGDYETLTVDELEKRWHDVEGAHGAIFADGRTA